MPRRGKRGWRPPPKPDPTTFIVCNLVDEWYVRIHLMDNEWLVLSDRCPTQHIVHLPHRLRALGESGAWFDSLEADWARSALIHQLYLSPTIANSEKRRCQAWNADASQCKHGAAEGIPFCKPHDKKRTFTTHRPGEGLDTPSENPISTDILHELSGVSSSLAGVLYELRSVQERIFGDADLAQRVGQQYAELWDARHRLDAIVRGDREREAKLRQQLIFQIQRMVDRICIARKFEGVEVHTAFIKSGGKKHDQMNVEELKGKVNWLFENYRDVFPVDGRTWDPPDAPTSGMEPGAVRVKSPDDPVIVLED